LLNGGSGANPEPTVKVWMGEGKNSGLSKGSSLPFFKPLFLIAFSKDPEVLHLFRVLFYSFMSISKKKGRRANYVYRYY
jgi:hypothetical protein